MSIKTTVRGATSLKTMTGKAPGKFQPHYAYMRLAALEMERHRREVEGNAAASRADKCAERCAQIDAEVAEIRAKLDLVQQSSVADIARRGRAPTATAQGTRLSTPPSPGAVIQY